MFIDRQERISSDRHRLQFLFARINLITPWRSVDYSKQTMESPHQTPALKKRYAPILARLLRKCNEIVICK